MWGIHRWPVNSLHKWPVARKVFPFDDAIMFLGDPFKSRTGIMVCLHCIPFEGIEVSVRDMIYRNIITLLFVRIHAILTLTPSTNLWTETINNLIAGFILYIHIYIYSYLVIILYSSGFKVRYDWSNFHWPWRSLYMFCRWGIFKIADDIPCKLETLWHFKGFFVQGRYCYESAVFLKRYTVKTNVICA